MIVYRTIQGNEVRMWLDFMCDEIFPSDRREDVESMWYSDSHRDVRGIFAAFDDDGSIIASYKVECTEINICGQKVKTGLISGVGTKKEYRGRGLNKKLSEMAENYMLSEGVKIIHLFSNPDTLEFYIKNRFLSLKKRENEDFYRMYRLLSPFTLSNNLKITSTEKLVDAVDNYKK